MKKIYWKRLVGHLAIAPACIMIVFLAGYTPYVEQTLLMFIGFIFGWLLRSEHE